jgi:MFS superfamily sulfate permease-like transporter
MNIYWYKCYRKLKKYHAFVCVCVCVCVCVVVVLGFEVGIHACKAGALPLEPLEIKEIE